MLKLSSGTEANDFPSDQVGTALPCVRLELSSDTSITYTAVCVQFASIKHAFHVVVRETKGTAVCAHSTPYSSALICPERWGEARMVTRALGLSLWHQAQITLSSLPGPVRSFFFFLFLLLCGEWIELILQIQYRNKHGLCLKTKQFRQG